MHFIPDRCRAEKPVVHISLNPHPDDRLTDTDMENIAHEYLVHIVTIRVKEDGKCTKGTFCVT